MTPIKKLRVRGGAEDAYEASLQDKSSIACNEFLHKGVYSTPLSMEVQR